MNEWNNISDDELDAILKKSAENFTPGFDESAWKDMSEKLDRGAEPVNPGRPYGKVVKWTLGGLVALLFMSGIYWVSQKESTAGRTEKKIALEGRKELSPKNERLSNPASETQKESRNRIKADEKTSEENTENVSVTSEGKKNDIQVSVKESSEAAEKINPGRNGKKKELNQAADTRIRKEVSDRKTEIREAGLAENRQIGLRNNKSDAYESKSITKGFNSASVVESKPQKVVQIPAQNIVAVNSSDRTEPTENSPRPESRKWGSIAPLKSRAFKAETREVYLPEVISTSQPVAIKAPSVSSGQERGFGFRVIYSPDITTIGSNKIFRIGDNIGLVGEYRFNSRWSVQAGAIKSLKYYEATPDQYKWPYFLVKPGNPLKVISATCNMLDIPVNVRYDFFSRPQHKWFASAGFTNYLMLKEKYKYFYENDADPAIKSRAWEGKTGFYPFGVLNISGGYERRITRKLSVQAEPFTKIPLGEVGYGKVKLITIGVFISGKIEI